MDTPNGPVEKFAAAKQMTDAITKFVTPVALQLAEFHQRLTAVFKTVDEAAHDISLASQERVQAASVIFKHSGDTNSGSQSGIMERSVDAAAMKPFSHADSNNAEVNEVNKIVASVDALDHEIQNTILDLTDDLKAKQADVLIRRASAGLQLLSQSFAETIQQSPDDSLDFKENADLTFGIYLGSIRRKTAELQRIMMNCLKILELGFSNANQYSTELLDATNAHRQMAEETLENTYLTQTGQMNGAIASAQDSVDDLIAQAMSEMDSLVDSLVEASVEGQSISENSGTPESSKPDQEMALASIYSKHLESLVTMDGRVRVFIESIQLGLNSGANALEHLYSCNNSIRYLTDLLDHALNDISNCLTADSVESFKLQLTQAS